MFQQIVEFLNHIPFFSSTAFGIIAMIIVGASWCLVGLVMGDAPKKGIDPSLVQLAGGLCSTVLSLTLMIATSAYSTASVRATFFSCLAYFIGAVMNVVMLQMMSKAMQLGPNGLIWAIIQSAMVFPFIGGILFFDVKLTILRALGICLLLGALALFSSAKDNTNNSKNSTWKKLALAAMLIVAVQQNLMTMPSYFESTRGVTSILRSLSTACGTLFMAALWNLVQMSPERRKLLKSNIKNLTLWKYVFILQFFSLLCAYTLQFPGMNVMADHGMGGMCYPMMVGSCIVGFTLSSVILLKEKLKLIQLAALTLCIAGLALICTQ